MSVNPLNELKRRLEDDSILLPKRLCLARNVVHCHHFPTAPKERVVSEWLDKLTKQKRFSGGELKHILGWVNAGEDLSSELKMILMQIVSDFVKNDTLSLEEVISILNFTENEKMAIHVTQHVNENLLISVALLKTLKNIQDSDIEKVNVLIQRVINHIIKHYKESKKKLEFIVKVLEGENLETIFILLDTDNRNLVIELCRNILFPMNKKAFFASYLQNLIRKDNIDELIAEKGDNIQSVLKIMNTFFEFPKGRTSNEYNFLCNFVDVFVTSFRGEHQLIFALYIMVTSSLNMQQKYLNPNLSMPSIMFEENDDKIKRNIFLKFLEILLQNEVDISVRLTNTFGEKIPKVEIKKNFTGFLQGVMMGLLKLEGKPDKTTMNIITIALQLDPVLIEPKLDKILPPIMAAKKNNTSTMETYTNMLKCLLQTLFKLSRATLFITQILPSIKLILEASNPEQFELMQKSKDSDSQKIISKIITSNDIMPQECIDMYGRWTSELMFRQNCELMMTLQKDFQVHCLMMLEEGYVSPSIITLTELLSAILSSFFENNKMADHTVPRHIAEALWSSFGSFENECLNKLGECVLKLTYNPTLVKSFLKLSVSFSRLKLINLKYGNIKVDLQAGSSSEVFDFSPMLPCLRRKQWLALAGKVQEDELKMLLDHLVTNKILAAELFKLHSDKETTTEEKSHLINQLTSDGLEDGYLDNVVLTNLEKGQAKQLAKYLVKMSLNTNEIDALKRNSVVNNRSLLNALVLETLKSITKNIENAEALTKALSKPEFDLSKFLKDLNVTEYFNGLNVNDENDIAKYVDILRQVQIYHLEEKYQLVTIFIMLAVKKNVSKKLRRNIDHLLQSIYEISPKNPDIYKIFPVNYIISFDDKTLIDLLTLKINTSNNLLLIISTLETGVKKVKTDCEIVKSIVEILLKKQTSKNTSSIEYFSDQAFQISCIILPIIAKEKRAITTSAFRSILADLQEKIHRKMLQAFKNIDFSENSTIFGQESGNPEECSVVSENTLAALNAIEAYSLTLSRYCETNDAADRQNLDFLWSGLNFFIQIAIKTIQSLESKPAHIESSIHLLNVSLRHVKKLENHELFKDKDKLFLKMWRSIKERLLMVLDQRQKSRTSEGCLENISVALKFILELSSIECFTKHFVSDLSNLAALKDLESPKDEVSANSILTSHKVSKYLTTQCLKANIIGPKCAALSKHTYKICKNVRVWIQTNYEYSLEVKGERIVQEEKEIMMEDVVCDVLRSNLEMFSEIVLAARRIILDYKFLDSIFELLHLVHCIMGCNSKRVRCKVTWPAFFKLYDGSLTVLNSLLVSREEILEDRWPCFMQCFRALVFCLCERSSSLQQLDTATEDRLAEAAHSIEKLTQSICKRKTHISRLAAYAVADVCSWVERTAPCKMVRQHLENSIVLFIQASDTNHAMAFLRRGLAGASGQMTMTSLYTMYKRYHKYVGNA